MIDINVNNYKRGIHKPKMPYMYGKNAEKLLRCKHCIHPVKRHIIHICPKFNKIVKVSWYACDEYFEIKPELKHKKEK